MHTQHLLACQEEGQELLESEEAEVERRQPPRKAWHHDERCDLHGASELLAIAARGHYCAYLFVEAEASEAQDISYEQLPVVQLQRAACLPP